MTDTQLRNDEDLKAVRDRQARCEKWIGTGFDTELLQHAVASANDVPALLGEVESWRNGDNQIAIDPPSLTSPRVPGVDQGLPVFFLQQTHGGIPLWICGCTRMTLGSPKPAACVACGDGHLSEVLHSGVLIDQDEPDKLLSE